VRHDIGDEELAALHVVQSVAVDQEVDAGVLVLPDQVDGLGHRAGKTGRRSTGDQPLALRRQCRRVAGKEPALDVALLDRVVVAADCVAVPAQHAKLVLRFRDVAADQIAGVGETGDGA
jgi:hypothetical protein